MWLFALLVAVPIIEIALFIEVGGFLGLWPTLAIVIATALFGSFLLRSQGIQTVNRLRSSMAEGRNPMDPIAHGALILVSAVLLLTPGFFTDAVGLSLLVPPIRVALIRAGASRFTSHVVMRSNHARQDADFGPDTVDGDFVVVDEEEPEGTPTRSGWTKKPDGPYGQ